MTATFRSLRMQPPLALRKVWWKDQRQRRFAYGRLTFSRTALRFARCNLRAAIRHRTVVGSRFQTSTWHVLECRTLRSLPKRLHLRREPAAAPAACRGVFVRVFDHELHRRGRSRNEDAVEVGRLDMLPRELRQDRPIREGERAGPDRP